MPKLQINEDLEQLNINSNIETESKHNTKLIPETTQERVKTKIVLKLKGRPKGLKNKVHTLNPKFNRET